MAANITVIVINSFNGFDKTVKAVKLTIYRLPA